MLSSFSRTGFIVSCGCWTGWGCGRAIAVARLSSFSRTGFIVSGWGCCTTGWGGCSRFFRAMSSSLLESSWLRSAIAERFCWSREIIADMITEKTTTMTISKVTKNAVSQTIRLRALACSASMYC